MKMYVACLASYNAGILHGAWLNVSTDADENAAAIAGVLASSKQPDAEEWAIHDYEGPRAIVDMLGENPAYATLAAAQCLEETSDERFPDMEESNAVLATMLDCVAHSDLQDMADDFDDWVSDHYAGSADTLAEWAAEFLEDTGTFAGLKDDSPLRTYFDFESYARDLRCGGDVSTERAGGKLMVFWNR